MHHALSMAPELPLTSGSATCGFTTAEVAMIGVAVRDHALAADCEAVLRSTPDTMSGTTCHRVCFRRFKKRRGTSGDGRGGAIALQPICEEKIRLFTAKIVDTKVPGWNRGSEWRSNGAGTRITMQNRLAMAVNNGSPWTNIQSALSAQVRDYSDKTGPLQDSLIRVLDEVTQLADDLYDEEEWPVTFLLELFFFLIDTVIAGPSAGAGMDAKRNLARAVPSGDLVSSARLFEKLSLAVKDPNGKKHMSIF